MRIGQPRMATVEAWRQFGHKEKKERLPLEPLPKDISEVRTQQAKKL
jgi:hypothetical protein